ncbi:MAG: hypothetical protein RLY82_693 [Pseudomonadota bacterium]
MNPKLQALRYLVAAIDAGSLRLAALDLRISQPALSKAIQELENQFNAPLLTRSQSGVAATAQGQLLYEQAQKIHQNLQLAHEQIQQLSGQMVGKLTIGAVPLAVMLLMPQTLQSFRRDFPDIQIRLSEELYIAQLQRLRKGDVDVAVAVGGIPYGLSTTEFHTEALLTTTMVVVVRKGHPLRKARTLSDLARAPWVYTGADTEQGYARVLFLANGLPEPPVGGIVNSTLALISLVTSSDCIGLMPEQIANHPLSKPFLTVVNIKEKGLPLTVGVIVKRSNAIKPIVRHMIAHLHGAAGLLA